MDFDTAKENIQPLKQGRRAGESIICEFHVQFSSYLCLFCILSTVRSSRSCDGRKQGTIGDREEVRFIFFRSQILMKIKKYFQTIRRCDQELRWSRSACTVVRIHLLDSTIVSFDEQREWTRRDRVALHRALWGRQSILSGSSNGQALHQICEFLILRTEFNQI